MSTRPPEAVVADACSCHGFKLYTEAGNTSAAENKGCRIINSAKVGNIKTANNGAFIYMEITFLTVDIDVDDALTMLTTASKDGVI